MPTELAGQAQALGAREQLFLAPPSTSQKDAVSAENYARSHGLAFLPTIDCSASLLQPGPGYGPNVVTAVITSPTPGQVLTDAIDVVGTVQFSPDQANFFKLEIIGPGFPDWTTIGSTHHESIINGRLETLYVPALQAGSYQLRLALVDWTGGFLQQPYVVPFTVAH